MTSSRGAASPDAHTQRRLFAASAGYCQNPDCSEELFIETQSKVFHIAEMAHVFAATDGGPRADTNLSKEERGAYENLILLCANCHTKVDKAPEDFPDEIIHNWKREHEDKLKRLFGVEKYKSREELRQVIQPLMSENYMIFIKYGPDVEAANNPESGSAERWKQKMLTRILPNNRRILTVLDSNHNLIEGDEFATIEEFRQHVDDLEAVHIEGLRIDAMRFPKDMKNILE